MQFNEPPRPEPWHTTRTRPRGRLRTAAATGLLLSPPLAIKFPKTTSCGPCWSRAVLVGAMAEFTRFGPQRPTRARASCWVYCRQVGLGVTMGACRSVGPADGSEPPSMRGGDASSPPALALAEIILGIPTMRRPRGCEMEPQRADLLPRVGAPSRGDDREVCEKKKTTATRCGVAQAEAPRLRPRHGRSAVRALRQCSCSRGDGRRWRATRCGAGEVIARSGGGYCSIGHGICFLFFFGLLLSPLHWRCRPGQIFYRGDGGNK